MGNPHVLLSRKRRLFPFRTVKMDIVLIFCARQNKTTIVLLSSWKYCFLDDSKKQSKSHHVRVEGKGAR
jgi:hypothetical protein